jgi:hypothetical protein
VRVVLGSGPVFYRGGELPEDVDSPTVYFEALSGNPNNEATLELDGDYLKITKADAGNNQEAVLRMGGLEAPCNPDSPLMVEFTLLADISDMVLDGDFSGVQVGLYANDSGFVMAFGANGGNNEIYLTDADLIPATTRATISYDWDSGVGLNSDGSNTYKAWWDPGRDLLRIYVKDPDEDRDQLIYDGTVSQFGAVPSQELRASQPWLIFGHGDRIDATSISRWKGVYLQNVVTVPVEEGILRGEHETVFRTNNQVNYEGTVLPKDADSAWVEFPDSFGVLGGSFYLTEEGLVLQRVDLTKGIGFYRSEPMSEFYCTVLDFTVKGASEFQGELVENLGVGVYISDGTRTAQISFLINSSGTQSVALLIDSIIPPTGANVARQSWSVMRSYRLVLEPGVGAWLYNRILTENEGLKFEEVLFIEYTSLSAAAKPAAGVGFLNDGTFGDAKSMLVVEEIRYSVPVTLTYWDDFAGPLPTWTRTQPAGAVVRPNTVSPETPGFGADASVVESGGTVTLSGITGVSEYTVGNWIEIVNGDNPGFYEVLTYVNSTTVTINNPSATGADSANPKIEWNEVVEPSFMTIEDADDGDSAFFTYALTTIPNSLQPDNGWSMEFKCRVVSYELESSNDYGTSGLNPVRAHTGVEVQVHDGTNLFRVCFLHAGPPNGRVVCLAPEGYEDVPTLLRKIRSGDSSVTGWYGLVDWSEFHTYRLEKTVGGKLRLLVDEVAIVDFNTYQVDLPTSVATAQVRFGHVGADIISRSEWEYFQFTISDGFDVTSLPVLSEDELRDRFSNGITVLAEAEDSDNVVFIGTPVTFIFT